MSDFPTATAPVRKALRGMTLLELATVLAIMGILAALTLNGLDGLNQRARFGLQAGDLASVLEGTRADAFGRGGATAFVVDTAGNRYWGIRTPTANAATFLDAFDPSNPGDVIFSGTLSSGTTFGPSTGYGMALPAPFVSVPSMTSSSPAPNLAYCSFCRVTGLNANFGLILFEPSGQVSFNSEAPTGTVGQQFSVTGASGGVTRIQTLAISAASGAIARYER